MSPPAGELLELAIYLALAGAVSGGLGTLFLRWAESPLRPGLRSRAFLSSIVPGIVALLIVIIVAQLMFISEDHDLKLLAAVVTFSVVLTGFFSLSIAGSVANRLREITQAVRNLASGTLQTHLDSTGGDELARLAADVNLLGERLEQAASQRAALDRERKELTSAISHDLRTPLSSLRAMVEALSDGIVTDAGEVHRYYAVMGKEIERLNRMIEDLFELAQMDAGVLRLNRQRVNIEEIAAEVMDAMQAPAKLAGVQMSLETAGRPVEINVDGSRIERALANLLRNALEHTPAGGRVFLSIALQNGYVELNVTDSGEGIPEPDLHHVWERFYRADRSRRRSHGNGDGAGLGLAIVRGIAEAHGGSVRAESEVGRGSTFTLALPTD